MISGIWNQAWNSAENSSHRDFSTELITIQSSCGTRDTKHLVLTLADLPVDCIHYSEQFSQCFDIIILPFFSLCSRDGFGHLDKTNPTLGSRTLESAAFSEKLLVDSLYVYCLRVLVIGILFCTLELYIISFLYFSWNYYIFLQEENVKQFNKRNKESSCTLHCLLVLLCTEES